ncbi:MAG: redoxin domain-containing protein [Gemmataceae bacterium]
MRLLILTSVFIGLASLFAAPADATRADARTIAPFRLPDPRTDKMVDLNDGQASKAIVVLFLGTECPLNNEYLPELTRLHTTYSAKGVRFLGINSNRQDTPARIAEHARRHALPFPILKDAGNRIADQFAAKRTPEVFLLDATRKVVYRGRIDDQFGIGYRRAGKPTRRDLALALDELLAGKPINQPVTEAPGCLIARVKETRPNGKITYTRHISRILQKHCQECHRPGQVGPMPLSTYDDAVAWADTIREVIDDGRMPPWFADPAHGKWSNSRVLSKEEKQQVRTWIDEGMPQGQQRDMPEPRKFPTDWQIGTPDVVLTMPRDYAIPAETPKGGVPYQYFSVPTNFKEDRWVVRAEARPGAPEVVHHILVFIVPPGEVFRPDGPGNILCGMAPGDMPIVLEPGLAKKVPAGSRLLFQMHYTPNGKAQVDRSSVGLIFAKEPPRHRVLTRPILNRWFMSRLVSIPPGAENFPLEAEHTFRDNIHIVAFMPHMHLRGKDFLYEAITPDGKKETLLSVPRYNFYWQSVYRAEKPVPLKKGTRLRCLGHFDNSAKNPNNPDPTARIFWGDQTWEEMLVGWIDYYVERDTP